MIHHTAPVAAHDLTSTVGEAQIRLSNMEEPIDRVRAFLNAMSHVIELQGAGKDFKTLLALATACDVVMEDLEQDRHAALGYLHPLRASS